MSVDTKQKLEEFEALKLKEATMELELAAFKAKAEKETEMAEEIETMKAKALEDKEALETFKAKALEDAEAKVVVEKAEFVTKAKSLNAICTEDQAEEFGADMYLFKTLAPESFERTMKHLEKADSDLKNTKFVFTEKGSTEEGADELEGEELIKFRAKALMKEDATLKPAAARTEVRKALRQEGKSVVS